MERLLALKRVPLFENLSLDQLDAVQQLARDASFLPGEVIVREGDPGGELFLLLEGSAEAWLDYRGATRSSSRRCRPAATSARWRSSTTSRAAPPWSRANPRACSRSTATA